MKNLIQAIIKSNAMKESDIQKEILKYLRLKYKAFCWKSNNVGIYIKKKNAYMPVGMKGVSDIIGILPNGKMIAIEVKKPKGYKKPKTYPTKHQKAFLDNITKNGGIAFVARSLDDVDDNL